MMLRIEREPKSNINKLIEGIKETIPLEGFITERGTSPQERALLFKELKPLFMELFSRMDEVPQGERADLIERYSKYVREAGEEFARDLPPVNKIKI
jgi:hypothetical protein